LYEIILQNYSELQQLPGLEDDLQYQQEIETKTKAYRAFRYSSRICLCHA
jgi:signal recognition particle subunit SRP68